MHGTRSTAFALVSALLIAGAGLQAQSLGGANALAGEKSPYLLQHAHNPVDWRPWGDAAFEEARRRGVPVFVSIGYATCHWCHVMERESFTDPEIAAYLNARFVCIKVDREERTDVDEYRMQSVNAMGLAGGWPLSVFMTADRHVFFGGTYFPPEPRFGMPGFREVLEELHRRWMEERQELLDIGTAVLRSLEERSSRRAAVDVVRDPAILKMFVGQASRAFDPVHGGFGLKPKFPQPHAIRALLRCALRFDDERSRLMSDLTLRRMAEGGVHDQLGGGFHRYSTDVRWLVPHFEKMLYDQAAQARAYTEAWQATGEGLFARTARSTCEYVLARLTSPEGAFYCAEDADSEGAEGLYYLWTRSEVEEILGADAAKIFCGRFHVEEDGNFEAENPRSILHVWRLLADLEREFGSGVAESLAKSCDKLLSARAKRVPPLCDDKVLAGWNGLMIGALAHTGATLGERRYVEAAARAARFVDAEHRDAKGRLQRRWREGDAAHPALADDYAYLADGMLELFGATGDEWFLHKTIELAEEAHQLFLLPEEAGGGYALTGERNEVFPVRTKRFADGGSVPSANSVLVGVMVALADITGDAKWGERGAAALSAVGRDLQQYPFEFASALLVVDRLLHGGLQVVIVGAPGPERDRMERVARTRYLPGVTLVVSTPRGEDGGPLLAGKGEIDGKPTAYVCRRFVCKAPTNEPAVFERQLEEALAEGRARK